MKIAEDGLHRFAHHYRVAKEVSLTSALRIEHQVCSCVQVVAAIRIAMYHIGQLKRTDGEENETVIQLYWLDAVRDVPALGEVL